MNDGGVCRNDPATPGMLNIYIYIASGWNKSVKGLFSRGLLCLVLTDNASKYLKLEQRKHYENSQSKTIKTCDWFKNYKLVKLGITSV